MDSQCWMVCAKDDRAEVCRSGPYRRAVPSMLDERWPQIDAIMEAEHEPLDSYDKKYGHGEPQTYANEAILNFRAESKGN